MNFVLGCTLYIRGFCFGHTFHNSARAFSKSFWEAAKQFFQKGFRAGLGAEPQYNLNKEDSHENRRPYPVP